MGPDPTPMDFFADAFQWHDKYLPPLVQQNGVLLLSETDLFMLASPGARAIEPLLRDRVSIASHCETVGVPALLAEMLHALETLVRQGMARPVRADDAVRHVIPDFSLSPARVSVNAHVDAILLSKAVAHDAAIDWARAAAGDATNLDIVFCDDYLDPRLGPIDTRQRAARRAWLLVKPTGEQAMVGPMFTPDAAVATACWHCLSHRLLRNRPARAWWQHRHGGGSIGMPVRADDAFVGERLQHLRALARDIVARAAQALWTLDPAQPHAVVARPQCPQCGDAQLMAHRQREPVTLESSPFTARCDGGWRTMPASATLERLAPHVDPLCGVVTQVVPVGAEAVDALAVYRSEIFRTQNLQGDLSAGGLVQVCLGKGVSTDQSRASALCEAVERYAAFYQGDEARVIAPAGALDARCILPQDLARFSVRQCAQAGANMPPHAVSAPTALAHESAWWSPAWSLTSNARCYLPLSFCYANAPVESQRHAIWTSNGSAAGNTLEEAILQGFLELVERDAAAVWWYGRIQRPAVDLRQLAAGSLARIERSLGAPWHFWVLDITHDFGIPVLAAVGRHRVTGEWAIGFGCSPDPVLACERALTEMGQLIAAGKTLSVAHSRDGEDAPRFLTPLAQDESGDAVPMRRPAVVAHADIAEEIGRCVGIAAALGMETVVLDCTRPDIPLRTVKVVVPGLCHIWPELGNRRLYDVPVAMGWRKAPLQESELNPVALYV